MSERSYAPMWPMRSILPFVWSWPPATVMPCVVRSRWITALASTPAGGSSAVTELAGLFEKSVQPSACAPARTAAPRRAWRVWTPASPSSRIIVSASPTANTRLTAGVNALSPSGRLFRALRRSQ